MQKLGRRNRFLNRSASHGTEQSKAKESRIYTTRSAFSLRVFTCLVAGCSPSFSVINYFENISIFAHLFFTNYTNNFTIFFLICSSLNEYTNTGFVSSVAIIIWLIIQTTIYLPFLFININIIFNLTILSEH